MRTKYLVYRERNGERLYKMNKCVDGWNWNPTACWGFSKQGAQKIAQRLGEGHGVEASKFYKNH